MHRHFDRVRASLAATLWIFMFPQIVNAQNAVSLPWSADPELVRSLTEKRKGFNYVESKVPSYSLPDPLVATDGAGITTPKQWDSIRRKELLELFRSQVYGRRPATPYSIRFEQLKEVTDALDGIATGQSMKAVVTVDDREFTFPFTVFIPNRVEGKVPATIFINNRDFTSLDKAEDAHDPFWPVRTLIERGYATASFHTSDVDPDRADGYDEGLRAFFAKGAAPADDAWRSLSAWGWAGSRVLDYLETIGTIDASSVAIVGHSRGGKTALWAASEDPRFAIAYSNDSGCGGAALSRRAYGETVGRITTSFPYWFVSAFAKYADRESELPIDQHELIALIAPRGVYVASAGDDLWADPKGEYASLVAAAPVFRLLGEEAISVPEMPSLDEQRIIGKTGYHIRAGVHNLQQSDWDRFLDFADRFRK